MANSSKKSKSEVRNSNIEILRIVSMFFIVAFHFIRNVHVVPKDHIVYALVNIIGSWGILGVDLFIIISAWFLSSQKFRIKKVIHIFFQMFSWVTFWAFLFILYDCFHRHNSIVIAFAHSFKNLINGLFDPLFASAYWFVTAYFFMLLLSPLLNKLLDALSQSKIKKLLLIFLFVPIYAQETMNVVCDVFTFSYIYLLIGYIKRYEGNNKLIEKFTKKPYYLLLMVIIILSNLLHAYFFKANYFSKIISLITGKTIRYFGRHSIIVLLTAILIFFRVLNKKPTYNKKINKISSYCLGIYLFHENKVFGFPNVNDTLGNKLNALGLLQPNLWLPLKYLVVVLCLFVVGLILEFIRDSLLQKPFMTWVSNKYKDKMQLIDNWFNNF